MENMSSALTLWVLIYGIISWSLFLTVAMWVICEKADWPGWSVLLPIYNIYVLHKIADKPVWWMIFWFLPIPIIPFVLAIIIYLAMAEKFGKGPLFGLGLVFLSPIFFPLLAFGDAEYEG